VSSATRSPKPTSRGVVASGRRVKPFIPVHRLRALLHGRMAGARVRMEPGTVRLLSPELALWQGGMEILLPQGPPLRGHVLQVMRREGNRWLILEAHPKLFPQFSLQGPQLQTEEVEP
jgi:hypothetical protein